MVEPSDENSGAGAGIRNAQEKFLGTVKAIAEANGLQLVVEWRGPGTGCALVQRPDGFSSFYAFCFDFGYRSAVFYLGAESVETASSEQQREVEFLDGRAMERVLAEIRQKIDAGAREAFPTPWALSEVRETHKPSIESRAASSDRVGARVWKQDRKTLARERHRDWRPPRRGHGTAIAVLVLLVAVVFTLAPVLGSSGGISTCRGGASCTTSPSYYASASFRELGVGGVYIPRGGVVLGLLTITAANGARYRAIDLYRFYVAW